MDAIICPSCQKQYKWNEKFAGRSVRCKCGEKMKMPHAPAEDLMSLEPAPEMDLLSTLQSPEAAATQDTYEVDIHPQQEPEPIARSSYPRAGAGVVATDRLLKDPDEEVGNALRNYYLPISILVLGAGAQLAVWMIFAENAFAAVIGCVMLLGLEAMIFSPLAVISMFIAAKIKELDFGPLLMGSFKMTCITIGAGGLADMSLIYILSQMEMRLRLLFIIAFVVNFIFIGLPSALLFRLETGETSTLISTIVFTRLVLIIGGIMFLDSYLAEAP